MSHKNGGQLFALDPVTGKVLWTGKAREASNSALVRAGDLLVMLHDDGQLIVATPSRSGLDRLRTYTVAESATWAQPTLSGNRILVKDVSTLALWTLQ
jgi:outer membrane protein assembly factor BamB